ncbi:MAG TPA: methylated-DNA--[protein]-cysteine S-methyltransferase [Xanthobacteraceae bacterium]|jgi:methylated-DNA-[protein]-cysteine S-methyltransferase
MTEKLSDQLRIDSLATPIGEALIITDVEGVLRALDWADCEPRMAQLLRLQYGTLRPERGAAPNAIRAALRRYFAGDLAALSTIPWRTAGTPFQRAVWRGLVRIAPGETLSYGALATRLGCPKAVRAVGHANGSNPISLVVPCHRVIGADGSLTGYGGGIERKRWLLAHEGAEFREGRSRAA